MKKILFGVLAVVLLGSLIVVWAQSSKEKAASPSSAAAQGKEGKTVFVDISAFGRKDHAANKITELHDKMAKEGFTVVDLSPYTENGDLEGFFVTYVK
jgi:hypothetical protein